MVAIAAGPGSAAGGFWRGPASTEAAGAVSVLGGGVGVGASSGSVGAWTGSVAGWSSTRSKASPPLAGRQVQRGVRGEDLQVFL
jgi:hypothetical protein